MDKQVVILGRYLEEYKKIQNPIDLREFYESYNKGNIKALIEEVKKDKSKLNEFSMLDQYYINEMLLTFTDFKYVYTIIEKYRQSGNKSDLKEEYVRFSDENLNTLQFFLSKKMLTGPENLVLKDIAENDIVTKNYECERIDLLLNMYKLGITGNKLYDLALHLYLTPNTLSRCMGIYEKNNKDNIDDVTKMYREVFVRNSDCNTTALEILGSKDYRSLAKKYIKDEVDINRMNLTVAGIKGSVLFKLTEAEREKINLFLNIFKEEYKKIHPEEIDEEIKIPEQVITFEEAKSLMTRFNQSGYSTKVAFCEFNGIDPKYFNKCKEVLENAPKKKGRQSKKNSEIKDLCKEIADKIKSGITEDGITREFDVLDYYDMSPYSIDDLMNQIIFLNRTSVLETVIDFLDGKKEITYGVAPGRITFDVDFNKKGNSGITVEKEDTEKCLEYLREKYDDVYLSMYYAALRRFARGYLSFDEKVKVK